MRTVLSRIVPRWAKDFVKRILRLLDFAGTRVRLAMGIQPLSVNWGHDRGNPIHRFYLEQFLREFSADIRGHCLEFQEDAYTSRFGGSGVKKLDILHLDAGNPAATIVADLTRPNQIPSDLFDCIICTHVLHLIFELEKAIADLHRILKPGGVLLVGVPHVSMYSHPHGCAYQFGVEGGRRHAMAAAPTVVATMSHEFWRFTPLGLHALLAQAFGPEQVLVRGYGNSLTAAGSMRGMATRDFTAADLDYHDVRFSVEVCARVMKKQ